MWFPEKGAKNRLASWPGTSSGGSAHCPVRNRSHFVLIAGRRSLSEGDSHRLAHHGTPDWERDRRYPIAVPRQASELSV
jgi:hypothetical protein